MLKGKSKIIGNFGREMVSTFIWSTYSSITTESRYRFKLNLTADSKSELALAA